VSSPSHVKAKDEIAKSTVVKASDSNAGFDLVFISDSYVPLVQGFNLNHIESMPNLTEGYEPDVKASIRGPTTKAKHLLPPIRDKDVV
jgi:hypothetical protein